ncbi:MAG TPA: extracellular solute-binding protein [Chloroflexota bacterium]|nr:extracellular solute-binding protein [Chloroflexota bacterium]
MKPDEFTSWRDLTKPQWKEKLVIGRDPMLAGYGRAMFTFFYMKQELGPDFITQVLKQNPKILRDDHTGAQWLGEGKYPVCFCSDIEINPMIDAGLPIAMVDPRKLQEATHATSAYANVMLANRAPHPNAAKVYVNWVLSQEGGASFSKAGGVPSLRVDVGMEGIDPKLVPDPSWPVTNTEAGLNIEEQKLVPLLRQTLGS